MSKAENRLGIILADGRSSIWGKSQSVPTALIPVCGKPLLAQRIDEFRDLGLQRIVVLTDEKKAIDAMRVGLNAFSLSLDILNSNEAIVDDTEDLVVATAEVFVEPVLSRLGTIPPKTVIYSQNGSPIGASVMGRYLKEAIIALRQNRHSLDSLQSTAASAPLDDVESFLNVNLDVLRGTLGIPRISGLSVVPHVYLEWVFSAKPANIKGAAHIGDGAILHHTARIKDCVIGREVTILPHARLERCVVLAGATVPESAHFSDAIVAKGMTVFKNANDTERELKRFALESAVR